VKESAAAAGVFRKWER